MAEFNPAYEKIISHEGGYVNDPDDVGGETYKGVARNMHSNWEGWELIDVLKTQNNFPENLDNDADLQKKIKNFYRNLFWDKIKGDDIIDQEVATSIFDFAVNAGTATSAKLAQKVVNTKKDGIIGPKTLQKLNDFNPELFLASFTIVQISRYISIVKKKPKNRKYFYGWVRRALNDN